MRWTRQPKLFLVQEAQSITRKRALNAVRNALCRKVHFPIVTIVLVTLVVLAYELSHFAKKKVTQIRRPKYSTQITVLNRLTTLLN